MAFAIYEDFPLKAEEIRLVRLLPARSHHEPLLCELAVAHLEAVPDYVCLSYTWGGQHLDRTVLFSNSRFPVPVTSSCFDALVALRRMGARLAWVDQLSIDQTNIRERNYQVQLIRWIFKSATRVYVWLSLPMAPAVDPLPQVAQAAESRNPTKTGILSLRSSLARAFSRSHNLPQEYKSKGNRRGILAQAELLAECLLVVCKQQLDATPEQTQILENADLWRQLAIVLLRPYFRRRWVIQEITSNKQVTVLSEDYSCNLNVFVEFMGALESIRALKWIRDLPTILNELDASIKGPRDPVLALGFNLPIAKQIRDALAGSGDVALVWLLHVCSNAEASLAHDVIYAISSMASRYESLPIPKYDSSIDRVTLEHARHIVQQGYGLAMIEDASLASRRSTLPPWIPDWMKSRDDTTLKRRSRGLRGSIMPASELQPSKGFSFELSSDRHWLTFTATLVGRIQVFTRVLSILFQYNDERPCNFAPIFLENLGNSSFECTDETRRLAQKLRPALGEYLAFAHEMSTFQETLTLFLAVIYVYTSHPDIKHDYKQSSDVEKVLRALLGQSSWPLPEKVERYEICFTHYGHIGLVPVGGAVNDEVIICEGMWNSMLVRPASGYPDTYIVVGDAFFLPYEEILGALSPTPMPQRTTLV